MQGMVLIRHVMEDMNKQLDRIEKSLNLLNNEYQNFVSAIGNRPFIRTRTREFTKDGGISREKLILLLRETRKESEDKLLTKVHANVNSMLMSHAIANLVDNAIKYSGSPSLIELKLKHTTSEIVIRIRDQGIGITGDKLERVQERFYRAKNASTANDSGRCKRTNTL